jgi:hypothetical protein
MSKLAAFIFGVFSAYALSGLLVAAILMSSALETASPSAP